MISVVIPVKDGGDRLRRCLAALRAQRTDDEVELIVIDSGSSDGSPQLAAGFGARVHAIAPRAFNHGATRNLGAHLAGGEIVVFTVQDAEPVGERWLDELVAPLREPGPIAATYGRQLARPDAPPHQRFYIDYRYGPQARIQRASGPAELTLANTLFSDVASAIRKPLLERFPFAEDILVGEDLEWACRILLAGYEIAYRPGAIVRHSHRYTLGAAFRRYFDQGAAARNSYMAPGRNSLGSVTGSGLSFLRSELGWMWRSGEWAAIPGALAHEVVRFAAFWLGTRHRVVPPRLRPHLSGTPAYWNQSR